MLKKLIVFDLDGTLAASKSPLDVEMSLLFHDLPAAVKVALISGGAWLQFERQVLSKLPQDERLELPSGFRQTSSGGAGLISNSTTWTPRLG